MSNPSPIPQGPQTGTHSTDAYRRFVDSEPDDRFTLQRRPPGGTRVMMAFPLSNLLSVMPAPLAAFGGPI